MPSTDKLYATCAMGLEALLADELAQLGAQAVRRAGAGVSFEAERRIAYRTCLWSRLANRVLLPVHEAPADSSEALYEVVRQVDWAQHLALHGTLAVDFFCARSTITHSQYGALKVKDAVVDQFREATGERPSVDREAPDVRINVYLYRNKARIAIDLSGTGLHRRGYRTEAGPAPLKENLAAALLLLCDWPARAAAGAAFVDPMCGSGTLAIEAALMAAGRAPGLTRSHFGFLGWKQHDPGVWAALLSEAGAVPLASPVPVWAFDASAEAVAATIRHAQAARVPDLQVARRALGEPMPEQAQRNLTGAGLVLTNPPYGERLQADPALYQALGQDLARCFGGWQGALFTTVDSPLRALNLPFQPVAALRNGALHCRLVSGRIPAYRAGGPERAAVNEAGSGRAAIDSATSTATAIANTVTADVATTTRDTTTRPAIPTLDALNVDTEAFANRVQKNLRTLARWARRESINAWRVYDADLPDFSLAIDLYELESRHAVVQEYQAPVKINPLMAEARLAAALSVLPDLLAVAPGNVHVRTRARQKGPQQYQPRGAADPWSTHRSSSNATRARKPGPSLTGWLNEYGARLGVNLSDYLDTGVFPDHRKVRRYIHEHATGQRFLNLFAYTAAATVQAANGGAACSVSVDLSRRYCDRAEQNLRANGANLAEHQVIRNDVVSWLEQAAVAGEQLFDLILLDPPTFSNSTRTEKDWDVQRDHRAAIEACLQLLSPEGLLIFSNNFRRFRLDESLAAERGGPALIEDRTRWSIDRDFQRNQRIHFCWFIRHAA